MNSASPDSSVLWRVSDDDLEIVLALGFPVFPTHSAVDDGAGGLRCTCGDRDCPHPAKHPFTAHGFKDGVHTAREFRQLCMGHDNLNLAGATGEIVVLDGDVKHGGDVALWALVCELDIGDAVDATVQAISGGGGPHLFFRASVGTVVPSSAGKLGPGIDVRAGGGYVILAPSRHIGGGIYNWESGHHPADTETAPLPPPLLERILSLSNNKQNGNRNGRRGFTSKPRFEDGERNKTLFAFARSMRAKGASDEAIRAATRAENQAKCQPPLSDREAEQVIASALKQPDRADFETGARPPSHQNDRNALPPYAEERMALTFTERHREDVRYAGDTKEWLAWDVATQLWRIDVKRRVFNFARAIVREFAPSAGMADKVSKVARASARAAVVSLASDDPRTSVLRADLDRHPMLAATPAGILDLETGKLRHNDRALLITKTMAVAPADTDTPHPLWTAFLNSTFVLSDPDGELVEDADGNFVPDTDAIAFLQRYYGSCLTAIVDDQKFVFHHGGGRNGKGILVYTVHDILGEYAVRLPSELFMERKMEPHRTELADLWGARLAVVSEIPTNAHWNQSRLMDLTGGDPVRANRMRQDPTQVPASHKLGFLGNTKPRFRVVNTAVIERLLLVRHPRSFFASAADAKQQEGGGVRDETLRQKLCAEYPAILRWLIDGCLQWQRSGLAPPDSIIRASREYLGQENLVGAWIKECCATAAIPNEEDGTAIMRASYNEWLRERDEFPVSDRKFKSDVESQGRRVYHGEGGTYIFKLKLSPDAHDKAEKARAAAKAARTADNRG